MFEYFNPHPQNKIVGDCVKRAFVVATDKDYNEVKNELNRLKKITKASKFNDNKNWKYYVEQVLKAEKMSFPAIKGQARMNGRMFTQQFEKGTYILRMAGHLTTCKNGVIYDTWNCLEKCVYTAYKIR